MIRTVAFRARSTFGALLFSLATFPFATGAHGQSIVEDFEGAAPTWNLAETDCSGPESTWKQKRANDIATRNRFEKIYFAAGAGTKVLVSHEIAPSLVIPELVPSVKVRSARPGIRLMARVVLPKSSNPAGDGPLTTTVRGDVYRNTGSWQTLGFGPGSESIQTQLNQELWVLRQKYGSNVSIENAYVDQVVLNLYTGPGTQEVQIDDLSLTGIASAVGIIQQSAASDERIIRDSSIRLASFSDAASLDRKPTLVKRDGSVLEINGNPFFPRIIEHNGEPLDYLKSLGFNVIELTSVATKDQLEQAEKLDIWLISPAPESAGLEPIGFEFDRVLAWSVGRRLSAKELQTTQQIIREIRRSDMREGRPIVAEPVSHWKQYGHEADVLSIGLEPLGTSFLASLYSNWLRLRSDSIGKDKPIWATIQTEFSDVLGKQIANVVPTLPPTPIEPQQLKFLAYEALSAGSRGLRFTSKNRLDQPDPSTRLRAMTIKWLLAHVNQLEPWAVGGALMGEVPTQDNHLEVTAINTNRSRLLLIQRPTHHEQYWAGDARIETIQFNDIEANIADQAFQIGEHGLVPIDSIRSQSAQAHVRVDHCPYATAVVMTQDPLVLNSLNKTFAVDGQPSMLQLHYDVTRQWLAVMQLINSQMGKMGRSSESSSAAINEAVNYFQKTSELFNGNSPSTSVPFLERTDERLAFARRELLTEPLGHFKSKTSTPFLTHASLVPLHWQLSERLAQAAWNPNGLAGGDFENLEHMTQNGWENKRFADPFVSTHVELSESAAKDGSFGLKLSVRPTGSTPRVVESTPVWVRSGGVAVRQGQMVRIHGWVNVPRVIMGSHDGLMIVESIGGTELAERVPLTRGWQEFTLYRTAPTDGLLSVTFALTGVGEAFVDEVTIRTIDLPPVVRSAQK